MYAQSTLQTKIPVYVQKYKKSSPLFCKKKRHSAAIRSPAYLPTPPCRPMRNKRDWTSPKNWRLGLYRQDPETTRVFLQTSISMQRCRGGPYSTPSFSTVLFPCWTLRGSTIYLFKWIWYRYIWGRSYNMYKAKWSSVLVSPSDAFYTRTFQRALESIGYPSLWICGATAGASNILFRREIPLQVPLFAGWNGSNSSYYKYTTPCKRLRLPTFVTSGRRPSAAPTACFTSGHALSTCHTPILYPLRLPTKTCICLQPICFASH
uniref:PS273R n=1 Tax=African swine fever virus TaxID=10497 RepID=A0A6G7KTZ7_ASF